MAAEDVGRLKRTADEAEDDVVEEVACAETGVNAGRESPVPDVPPALPISEQERVFALAELNMRRKQLITADDVVVHFDPEARPRHLLVIDIENCRDFFKHAAQFELEDTGRRIIPPSCYVLVCFSAHRIFTALRDWLRGHVVARLAAAKALEIRTSGSTSNASDITIISQVMRLIARGQVMDNCAVTCVSADQDFNEFHSYLKEHGRGFQRFLTFDDDVITARGEAFKMRSIGYFFTQLRSRLASASSHKRSKGPTTQLSPVPAAVGTTYLDFSSQVSLHRQLLLNPNATVP